jgi:hypothetical protein
MNAVGNRIVKFRTIRNRGYWEAEFSKGEWPTLWVMDLEDGHALVGPCDPNDSKRTCEVAFFNEDGIDINKPWVAWVSSRDERDGLYKVTIVDMEHNKTFVHTIDSVYFLKRMNLKNDMQQILKSW